MNLFVALRSVVAFAWCAAMVLPAQQRERRLVLPDVPYDYAPLAAPGLGARFPLPARNGFPRDCSGPALPAGCPDRTNELATLGRVLFYDPLLSRNQSRSCASCHQQARAFADGQTQSRGFGGELTRRNSMSIANLGLLRWGYFWDARANTLWEMVGMPIQDPIEMGMDLPGVVARLRAEPGYAELFARAFGEPAIDADRLRQALAQFVCSIVSLRSRYDEGLAATRNVDKDFPNFSAAENRGKKLFFGDPATRGRSCAGCHVGREYGFCGNSCSIDPVSLQTQTCRNNGLDGGAPSDDPGLGRVTGKADDRGKFRAPSLRNVELTGPYMHDGRLATLEQVMQFYSDRVQAHPNLDHALRHDAGKPGWGQSSAAAAPVDLAIAAAPLQRLGVPLTSRDRADLVAFLKTLTDWELVRDPRFSDPFVQEGPSPAPPARGTVTVDAGACFEPVFWTLRCEVPPGKDWFVSHRPWALVERKDAQGRFVRVVCDEARLPGSTEDRFDPVRGCAGKAFLWSAELTDPRVVAVPGEYRLRVQWAVAHDRDVRLTEWMEFVIGDSTAESSFAAFATQEQARKTHETCMLAPLVFPAFGERRAPALLALASSASCGGGGSLFALLDSERAAARALLRGAPALPERVRARLDLLDIAREALLAGESGDPAIRRARWTMVDALAAAELKAEPPRYYAELAALVQLGAWRALDLHAELREAPWSDERIAVAIGMPVFHDLLQRPEPRPTGSPPGPGRPPWPPPRQ